MTKLEEYKDGHGCYVSLKLNDEGKIEMEAGGDNNSTLIVLLAAFLDIAKEMNVKPYELLPFITKNLVE